MLYIESYVEIIEYRLLNTLNAALVYLNVINTITSLLY